MGEFRLFYIMKWTLFKAFREGQFIRCFRRINSRLPLFKRAGHITYKMPRNVTVAWQILSMWRSKQNRLSRCAELSSNVVHCFYTATVITVGIGDMPYAVHTTVYECYFQLKPVVYVSLIEEAAVAEFSILLLLRSQPIAQNLAEMAHSGADSFFHKHISAVSETAAIVTKTKKAFF